MSNELSDKLEQIETRLAYMDYLDSEVTTLKVEKEELKREKDRILYEIDGILGKLNTINEDILEIKTAIFPERYI